MRSTCAGSIGSPWSPDCDDNEPVRMPSSITTSAPTAFFAVTVMVTTYHIFSEWLSLIVKTRSSQAVKRLLDLRPETARIVADGQEREVPIEDVKVGDHIRVRPGERIPTDGIVVSGHSGVDQSLVTGEAVPVVKREGDPVIGGSINGTGTLLVNTTAVGEGSFLQQVIRHVEDGFNVGHQRSVLAVHFQPNLLTQAGRKFAELA